MKQYILRRWVDIPLETVIESDLPPDELYDLFYEGKIGENSNIKIIEEEQEIPEKMYYEDSAYVVFDENYNILVG